MVHKPGKLEASCRCASAMISSSPSCVQAAISSGRPCSAGRRRSSSTPSTSGGGESILRLPAGMALGAPSVVKLRASPLFCASTSANRLNKGCAKLRLRRHLRNERFVMRPLTSVSGMPRVELSRIRLGQISDSVNTARSGCQ